MPRPRERPERGLIGLGNRRSPSIMDGAELQGCRLQASRARSGGAAGSGRREGASTGARSQEGQP
eukprot:299589-Alexandrium_andersonii.AAC.1